MASNEETRKLLEKAEEQFQKTEQQLQEFKEDGKWLDERRTKRRTGRLDDDEKEEKKRLEEKERLEKDVRECRQHVQELQLKVTAATQTGNDFVTRASGT